jgi:hypothetical protein
VLLLDRRIVAELEALRGAIPHTVDVRGRVRAQIDRLGAVPADQPTVRELAWATVVAMSGIFGLGAALWSAGPSWSSAATSLLGFGRASRELLATLWGLLATALSIPLKLLVLADDGVSRLATLLDGLQPVALAALAVSYVLMGILIVHFVGRDLFAVRVNGDRTR